MSRQPLQTPALAAAAPLGLAGDLVQANARGGLAPSEKQWECWVIEAFEAAGGVVHKLSQPRRTMQTEGLPDLYVMFPRRGVAFWFEVKRPGGKLREEQARFRERCLRCGARHYFGALEAAKEALRDLRLLHEARR